MRKWSKNIKGQKFGIYPHGTKNGTFEGGSTSLGVECGRWTLRFDVNNYNPNGKFHKQRSIRSGKNPDNLYKFAIELMKHIGKNDINDVNKIMLAKLKVLKSK